MAEFRIVCPEDYNELLKLGLSHEEVEMVLSKVERRYTKPPVMTPELGDKIKANLLQEAYNIHQPLRRAKMISEKRRIDFHEGQKKDLEGAGLTKKQALEAALVGTNRPADSGRLSVDAYARAYEGETLGKLINDLEKEPGLKEIAETGKIDREIAQELYEIRDNGNPGVSGNKQARKIAESIHKSQNFLLNRLNDAGAYIRRLPGYIIRQTHSRVNIKKVGFERWYEFIIDKLDPEETFHGYNPRKFLGIAYNDIISGRYEAIQQGSIPRTGDLALRNSQERVLHFKSADDWYNYHLEYGNKKSLIQNVKQTTQRSARDLSLMEFFGPNSRETFNKIVNDLRKETTNIEKQSNDFEGRKLKRLNNTFDELDGTTTIPVDTTIASVGRTVRAIQNMSKLGMATVSALADVPFFAHELNYQGVNLLKSYQAAFTTSLKGYRKGDQREIARLIGVGLDGMRGSIISRFSGTDDIAGFMGRAQQTFFKWTGLEGWTDAHKIGMVLISSNHMADQRKLPFDKINKQLRELLKQYNIDGTKWDMISKSAIKADDGNYYVSPDTISKLDTEMVRKKAGLKSTEHAEKYKDELATTLRVLFLDRAEYAVPTPGAKEFAMMRRGTRPGTVLGEAMRFLWQFKSFPLTVVMKPIAREISAGRYSKLAQLLVATTVMGYVAMTAKDFFKGKTPRAIWESDENWQKILISAFVQGGGAGLYGDFLFGTMRTRYGAGPLESLLGPTFGSASEIAQMVGDTAQVLIGEKKPEDLHLTDKMFRFGTRHIPFGNVWYAKAALDYLMLYHIQEALNPGYLRRMEKNAKKWNDQKFIVSPRKAIKTMYK